MPGESLGAKAKSDNLCLLRLSDGCGIGLVVVERRGCALLYYVPSEGEPVFIRSFSHEHPGVP